MKGVIYFKESVHDFEKTSLIGDKNHGDTYKCVRCGIEGVRPAFEEYLNIKNCKRQLYFNCVGETEKPQKKIRLIMDIPVNKSHGLIEGGIYETIECPDSHKHLKSEAGVWVMSKIEPVRIHPHEYTIVQQEGE